MNRTKYTRIFLLVLLLSMQSYVRGQMVGASAFLQGRYLEIGICGNGSFGASGSPTGYHPHSPGTTVGSPIAEVYDIGHDGWMFGTPAYMGDYTFPGSPVEGWEIQMNGSRAQQYQSSGIGSAYSGSAIMTGSGISSYSNSGGIAQAVWTGNLSSGGAILAITQTTQIDTCASWVTVTVKMKNTSSANANGVYYFRTCDPDNDATWPGGGFSTDNWVTYQNDIVHRVLVSAKGSSSYSPYLGLGTIDSRAVALVYNAFPLTVSQDLAAVWNQTYSTAFYTTGVHHPGDIGIGLVFNVGTILPGDSSTLSYAYVFSGTLGIDTAIALSGGTPSLHDSFRVVSERHCEDMDFTVYTHHYTPGLSIKTYYGDGSVDVHPMVGHSNGGILVNYAHFDHLYPLGGTYTAKQILYTGAIPIDSITQSYMSLMCNDMYVHFYFDANYNCIQDTLEPNMFQPILTEVDSNGVPIDTISGTSGFYYRAYGHIGDVYKFRVLHISGATVTCPSSGIITDTLQVGAGRIHTDNVGINCLTGPAFDLSVYGAYRVGVHAFNGLVLANNTYCAPVSGDISITLSPKYTLVYGWPSFSVISGQTGHWNFTGLTASITSPLSLRFTGEIPIGTPYYTPGDTVNSVAVITPTAGDINPSDNIIIRVDTVKSGFDPNYIGVSPSGYIPAGTELTYTIGFENTGNDTAHNIYIMDTLSGTLDPSSFRMVAATASMDIQKIRYGSQRIMRFDFPNIMLPDSSHHNQCDGFLMYKIKTLVTLPNGTHVPARAGIYFDDNDVVVTNTATDIIAGSLTTGKVVNSDEVLIYPNPTTGEFVISAGKGVFTYYTITNSMGQVLMGGEASPSKGEEVLRIDVSQLPAGLYYVMLRGEGGSVVRKVVKE